MFAMGRFILHLSASMSQPALLARRLRQVRRATNSRCIPEFEPEVNFMPALERDRNPKPDLSQCDNFDRLMAKGKPLYQIEEMLDCLERSRATAPVQTTNRPNPRGSSRDRLSCRYDVAW